MKHGHLPRPPLFPLLSLLLGVATVTLPAAATPARAASRVEAPHLRVELLAQDAVLTPGQGLRLGLHFQLERGWHVYWRNPGDSGQPPSATWSFEPPGARLRVDALSWPTPERLVTGPLANYGYEDDVVLLTTLHPDGEPGAEAVTVTAAVSWLVCSEPCIPGEATLSLTLPVRGRARDPLPVPAPRLAGLFAAAERRLPGPLPAGHRVRATEDTGAFSLRIAAGDWPPQPRLRFYPLHPDEIENAAEQALSRDGDTLVLKLPRAEQLSRPLARLDGLLDVEAGGQRLGGFRIEIPVAPGAASAPPPPPPPPAEAVPLGMALLLALLGGMLLNLMPCVFPVLCIKALALVEMSAADRRKARGHGLLYAAGILASFWVLAGLLIALRRTGQELGWGFHLQSPRFLIGLSALLFLLGLNLLGVFEMGLGLTQLGGLGAGAEARGRPRFTAFATGVLATVVATPCTAPFMGTAVGFALAQPPPVALLVFSALGLGLALPYVLLLWVPALRRLLPRPGAWMETFKQLMGFLLLGTVLWLAWVLAAQCGAERVVALFGGLLGVGVAAWSLGRWPERGPVTALAVALIFLGALGPGWHLDASRPAAAADSGDGLRWEPFSPARLAAYRQAGTPVLLDFTAEWCVSCKVNERLVLRSREVERRIGELGVVPMKADWTTRDPAITQALAAFGRSGIPFYVLYGRSPAAAGIELPAVLTTGIVLRALDPLGQNGPNGPAGAASVPAPENPAHP